VLLRLWPSLGHGDLSAHKALPRQLPRHHNRSRSTTQRIFDAIGDALRRGNLLIEGSKIRRISADATTAPANAQVINKIATSGNCDLFALSGPRNAYKEAKLGVLKEGAWADMLLVAGDPTADIDALADPQSNFLIIIKNGKIYKNVLR
jgi:imidazolonepropionase-like amidohydrolase